MTVSAECLIEALLLTQNRAISARELRQQAEPQLSQQQLDAIMAVLQQRWRERGLVLNHTAEGWRFHAVAEVTERLEHLQADKPPRYSRAGMETLAIIAYRQPVTRGDIEDIRGVTVNSLIIKQLEDRGWVEVIGHRETVGRPALFATTRQFLDDMGLQSLDQLPVLDDPTGNANVLEAMAAVTQEAMDVEPDLLAALPSDAGLQPSVEVAEVVPDAGDVRPVDDFFQDVETDLHDDDVDAPGGIQGNT